MANNYCTIIQFFNRYDSRVFGQLSTDDGTRDTKDDRVQAALDDASSELESTLASRYTLPVVNTDGNVPNILRRWVATKAADHMYGRRTELPDRVKRDFEWCDNWLQQLLERKISIPDVSRTMPELDSSESKEGRSRFDGVIRFFDYPPTQASTSRGKRGLVGGP